MLKIMLVDNSPERVRALKATLVLAGFDVVAYLSSTHDLQRRVSEIEPDVIIIDTDSPDRDTLENICVLSRDAPRPVVMFAQDAGSATIREAVSAGVSAYVVDGIAPERVRPIIDAAIARFEQFQALRLELRQAEDKLAERKVIERAKGILMQGMKLTEEQAYQALRRQAMEDSLRMGEVARRVIALSGVLIS